MSRLSYSLPGGRLRKAFRDADRISSTQPGAHWAIEQFPSTSQPWIRGGRVCPLGSRTRGEHIENNVGDGFDVTTTIPFTDEYLEWTAILEAVLDAGDTFTFLEVGAGYGRWTSRAAAAARMKGKTFRAGLAEADPRHAAWAREHMLDNEIADYRLFEAAVGQVRRKTMLGVIRPPVEQTPGEWYGQAIGFGELPPLPVVGEYHGKPMYEGNGWRFIQVDEIPLSDMLEPFGFVDLVDLDIQGAEGDAVRGSLETLTATTRRLHIETHTRAVEVDLRDSLASAGWRCVHDYDCLQDNVTAFGACYMVGGQQTWVNPRLLDRRSSHARTGRGRGKRKPMDTCVGD